MSDDERLGPVTATHPIQLLTRNEVLADRVFDAIVARLTRG